MADEVDPMIDDALTTNEGRSGLIALDTKDEVKFGFNAEHMCRGVRRVDGKPQALIYGE